MTTTTVTRKTTISERKHNQLGIAYDSAWIGTRIVWADFDGDSHVGSIESIGTCHGAKALFDDGRWAWIGWNVTVIGN